MNREFLEMKATLNNQKFEISTTILNKVKNLASSGHFVNYANNGMNQDPEMDPPNNMDPNSFSRSAGLNTDQNQNFGLNS